MSLWGRPQKSSSVYNASYRSTSLEELEEHELLVIARSTPGRTRTYNPWFRRPVLYPIELRTRSGFVCQHKMSSDLRQVMTTKCKVGIVAGGLRLLEGNC